MKHFLLLLVFLAIASGLACHERASLAREPIAPTIRESGERANVQPEAPQQNAPLKLPLKNPSIVVLKSKRRLELYSDGSLVRSYKVGLGLNPVSDKQRQGDRATPEGEFYVFTKNDKSAFYLSLGIIGNQLSERRRRGARAARRLNFTSPACRHCEGH